MQRELKLEGGHHAGPLFIVVKRRAPKTRNAFDGSRRIWGMVRRQSERRATPAWADRNLIASLYKLARIYTRALGVRFSVDHDYPLRHPRVCGLHVGENLSVSLLVDNVRKGQWSHPDAPFQQMELL